MSHRVVGVGECENRYNQHQQPPGAHQERHQQQMSNNKQAPWNQVGSQSSKLEAPVQQPTGRASSSASSRARFIKSKSSPSSLTTHRFGLRPTPSPPRLIIDHQTGDIVERYPESRVYLRTYQPIGDTNPSTITNTQNDDTFSEDDDATQNQLDSASFGIGPLQQQQQQPHREPGGDSQPEAAAVMSDFNQHTNTSSRPTRGQGRQGQVMTPPHAGKVYFAPPVTGNNNLFEPQLRQQQLQHHHQHQPQEAPALGASFRQTLNKLSDSERTDIAILTEPDSGQDARTAPQMKITATSASKASALLAKQQPKLQVISTNASKLYGQPAHSRSPSIRAGAGPTGGPTDKWKASAQHQQLRRERLKRQQTLKAIEDFDLYNFCFNFRILMVLLVSAAIIYLLSSTLNADCHSYRPTYTYSSMFTASLNLIFVLIFSLFWYCTSVSRTLYQNLSSSAFIVTIYSILVCVNLNIGILFFFINTCHFQKLLMSQSARHLAGSPSMLFADRISSGGEGAGGGSHVPLLMASAEEVGEAQAQQLPAHFDSARRQQLMLDEIIDTIERQLGESDKTRWQAQALGSEEAGEQQRRQQHSSRTRRRRAQSGNSDDATVLDDQLNPQQPDEPPIITTSTSTTAAPQPTDFFNQDHASGYLELPEQSPLEAAWQFVKDQTVAFWRHFYRFLLHYDLKFVGALHAICAACFQYLAIKVAVVRSFYCSPGDVRA